MEAAALERHDDGGRGGIGRVLAPDEIIQELHLVGDHFPLLVLGSVRQGHSDLLAIGDRQVRGYRIDHGLVGSETVADGQGDGPEGACRHREGEELRRADPREGDGDALRIGRQDTRLGDGAGLLVEMVAAGEGLGAGQGDEIGIIRQVGHRDEEDARHRGETVAEVALAHTQLRDCAERIVRQEGHPGRDVDGDDLGLVGPALLVGGVIIRTDVPFEGIAALLRLLKLPCRIEGPAGQDQTVRLLVAGHGETGLDAATVKGGVAAAGIDVLRVADDGVDLVAGHPAELAVGRARVREGRLGRDAHIAHQHPGGLSAEGGEVEDAVADDLDGGRRHAEDRILRERAAAERQGQTGGDRLGRNREIEAAGLPVGGGGKRNPHLLFRGSGVLRHQPLPFGNGESAGQDHVSALMGEHDGRRVGRNVGQVDFEDTGSRAEGIAPPAVLGADQRHGGKRVLRIRRQHLGQGETDLTAIERGESLRIEGLGAGLGPLGKGPGKFGDRAGFGRLQRGQTDRAGKVRRDGDPVASDPGEGLFAFIGGLGFGIQGGLDGDGIAYGRFHLPLAGEDGQGADEHQTREEDSFCHKPL